MGDKHEDGSTSGHEESHSGMDASTQDKDRHVEADTMGNLDGDFEGDEGEEEGKVETTGKAQAPKPSRKRTRQGRYISDISREEVLELVHLPASVACSRLGVGLTSFKRLCRGHGILVWPYKATPGKGAGTAVTGQPRNVQQAGFQTDDLNRKVVNNFESYNHLQQLASMQMGNGDGAMQQQMQQMQQHPLECSHIQIPEEVLINLLLGHNADPTTRTLMGMKLHLLKIMRFSETMKNEVGFSIIRDDVVESLYQLTGGDPNEALTMY